MKFRTTLLVFVVGVILHGCYPYPSVDLVQEDLDIVVTAYNENVDFTQYTKYYLYDSVQLMVDEGETVDASDPFYANGIDQIILNEIETQMSALNYQRVPLTAFPNVGVVATVFRVSSTTSTGYPGWWWGYPGYGNGVPGFGGGVPPYWYSNFYTYETGTVVLDMRDLRISVADSSFVWTGLINGLVDETTNMTGERVKKGVESAFLQSPNFYPREDNQ